MPSSFYSGFALSVILGWFLIYSNTLENYKKLSKYGKKYFVRVFFASLTVSAVSLILAVSPLSVHNSPADTVDFLVSGGVVVLITYCVLGTGRLDD